MINSFFLFLKHLKILLILKPALILLLFSTIFWQCISPPDYLGGDLITSQDEFNVKIDTLFSLSAYTLPYDTANTMYFSEAVLGETFDEIFGRTKSSFLTQLRLGALNHSYGDSVQIDSVFLFLKLKDKLGNEPIKVGVYELTDSLSSDSTYNALDPIEGFYHPVPIGSRSMNTYNGDESVLKIAINKNWVDSTLINVDSVSMSTSDLFAKHLYGIYIKTEGDFASPAKGMYYFDYSSDQTKLVVYYRNKEQDTTSMSFTYLMNDYCVRFNHYQHDFSMVNNIFNDTINPQQSVFYLKGLNGSRGVIMLDDIMNWLDSMPVAIHRAELRIELEDDPSLPPDTLVDRLFIYKKLNNKYTALVDYQISSDVYGGKYIKSKKYYSFNITFHIQEILTSGTPDKVLYIEPMLSYSRANSAILRSGSHSRRMKLILTYTKL
jgi:hypothetical protein